MTPLAVPGAVRRRGVDVSWHAVYTLVSRAPQRNLRRRERHVQMAMNDTHDQDVRVDPEGLLAFATAVLEASGVPRTDAVLVAECLIEADLWGHQSHGTLRLSWYVARLRSGVMRAGTIPRTIVDHGPVTVIDGGDGIGQVVMAHASREAIARAKHHGIGAVGVRNSNHFGAAGHFAAMAAKRGCIGVIMTNASPAMAPWGGRVKAVGTNPWSIAAPAGRFGVAMLDVANTRVARGKVYLAQQRGEQIPVGWALDSGGEPTVDPAAALRGLILPMADHKGYAIAFMVDVLSGVLTGGTFGAAVNGPYQARLRSGAGHLFIALDIAAFQDVSAFDCRMEALIAEIKSVPTAPGFDEVLFPGEREQRNADRNRRAGLVLPGRTITDLEQLAQEYEIPFGIAWSGPSGPSFD